jgi:simple sugar transport system permease protein
VDVSWIIALALVIFLFIYFKYTKHGYEISVVGDSQNTARYAGMNVSKIVLRTMFLSAGICGLAGMLQVAGDATTHTLSTGIASGVGFTAIIVAWLAKLNPFGIVAVSCMFGLLDKGCGVAESTFNLSGSVADILQGIILFFILAFDFFIQYKLAFKKAEKTAGGADN